VPVAAVADVELSYEEHGSGPPLLLIAGIPAVASDWRPVAERMATDGRRAIAYDNRGGGASTVTPGPYTTRDLAADAVALLDHLGIDRADVFGMSLGGMIAQELAIGWPERVGRLVLGCTHAGVDHAARQPREAARAFAMETDDWAERMAALAPFAFASDVDPGLLERFIAKKSADVQDDAGYRAQIAAVLTHDSFDRLDRITAPTLVITGDDDRVIPAPSSDVLADRIPDARLVVIPGTGHLFFIERPEDTHAVLSDFLAA
jgi:3-oxoadipate enol-lactonase